MVSEAIAGLAAFKTLMDTATGLKNIHDATVRDQSVFTLQREILAAQATQMALVERVGDLEKQITEFDAWDAEKQRYELKALVPGVAAYIVKPEMQGAEPVHSICAKCYEDRHKSILQLEVRFPGRVTMMVCHRCGAELITDGHRLA